MTTYTQIRCLRASAPVLFDHRIAFSDFCFIPCLTTDFCRPRKCQQLRAVPLSSPDLRDFLNIQPFLVALWTARLGTSHVQAC